METEVYIKDVHKDEVLVVNTNNISIDDDKEYTLEELNNLLSDTRKLSSIIRKKINDIKLKEMDFVGKVIYYQPYGYMFVKQVFYFASDDEYNFYGVILNAYIDNEYPEESYFNYDSYNNWKFPTDTMIHILNSGDFEIVDNDKFVKSMNSVVDELKKNIEIISKKILE